MTTSHSAQGIDGTQRVCRSSSEAGESPATDRKVHVKSFGCQMNVYDAQRMVDALAPAGFTETGSIEDADLVILNTCHIREKATEKIFSELGKLRVLKRDRAEAGRDTTIAVAGCVAQAEGAEIMRRQRAVDIVVGPQSYHRLPDIVARASSPRRRVVDTEFALEDKFERLPPPAPARIRARGVSAFVTVQEGCDKFCTFCVVPYTRGAETSRPVGKIVVEVERLAAAGVREVTLLGQNVNAYHGLDDGGAARGLDHLTARLAAVPGIARVRYTTSHPRDMSDALIAAHAEQPALMPFLHLPIQSGSDRILAAMNRRHTAEDYRRLVERVRRARPDIALSSDFIVGFPGETDADFEDTLRLVREIGFASSFYFKYSPRLGTPGADMPNHVPEGVKAVRLALLQAVIEPQRQAFNQAQVGRTLHVLFEKAGRHPGQVVGKSPYLQPVQVMGPSSMIGDVAAVEIGGVGPNSLFGRLVGTGSLRATA